jgi:hypothetical protein
MEEIILLKFTLRLYNFVAAKFGYKRIVTPSIKKHRSIVAERLNQLLERTTSKRYLEIGVYKGFTFELIKARQRKGIDPKPKCKLFPKNHNFSLATLQSDDFFAIKASDIQIFDVVYVDGLHDFRQCYRDVVNSINILSDEGFVLIDDVKPANTAAATKFIDFNENLANLVDTQETDWQGDVFLVIETLIKFHHREVEIWTLKSEGRLQTVVKKKEAVKQISGLLDSSLKKVESISFEEYFSKGIPESWNLVDDRYFFEKVLQL